MFVLIIITWYIIGVASFIYWWTEDHDFRLNEIPMLVLFGSLGPVTFLMGWMDSKDLPNPVLKRRREEK